MNVDQFREAIRSAGLEPPEVIEPGKLHRFTTNGKGSDDAGWCKLFADGGGGVFGDFRSGLSETWQAQREKPFTPAERESFRRRCEAERRAREAEEAHRHAEAARNASSIWKTSTPTSSTHRYVAHKQIAPVESLRDIDAAEAARILGYAPKYRDGALAGRLLVVPIKVASELSSVEFIDESGRKSALYGGPKKGGYWEAQDLPDGDGAGLTLLIGEGVATVLSAREATGYLVIAALSCGNLLAVTREMRKRFPAAKLGVLADLGNGKDKAEEAARATSSVLVLPDFGPNPPDGLTDFNDMHQHRGWEAIAECIRRQMATSSAQDGTPPGSEDAPGSDSQGKARAEDATGEAEDLEATVRRLAELAPIAYDRVRQAEADALGVRVATLDAEVEKTRWKLAGDGNDSRGEAVLFPDIEPSPEPVDGGVLLTDLAATCRSYVALPKHADTAIALWIVFTHAIDVMSIAAILALTSPEKRCGKTTLLALLRRLARRPLPSANITAPSLFRAIEAWSPTLLIDEGDSFLRNSDELRGVLNSGHTRDSAFVIRTVGEDHEPRRFSTWGAKAIALIGKLPDTLADRSIEVRLQRKLPSESVQKVRHADPDVFLGLARRCARWAVDHIDKIRAARPSMPDGLHDRAQDNWEPLIAIADIAGGDWRKLAREAALALSGAVDAENDNIRVQLLADIRDVFASTQRDRLPTVELIAELSAMEDRPWCEANRGKSISARWLAARLRAFGITVGAKRSGETVFKGYKRDQFKDAWVRYLPTSDRLQSYNLDGARVSADPASVTQKAGNRSENTGNPSTDAGCNRVTDPEPLPWGMRL